jgi:hypothetical protein
MTHGNWQASSHGAKDIQVIVTTLNTQVQLDVICTGFHYVQYPDNPGKTKSNPLKRQVIRLRISYIWKCPKYLMKYLKCM